MSILDDIRAYKLADVAARKVVKPIEALEAEARAASPVRPFALALRKAASAGGYGLIGELKKASPSKGVIRADFDPAALADAYAQGRRDLPERADRRPELPGRDAYLGLARGACTLPVLRKDFLYDPWQVVKFRALGADAVLIILASVSDAEAAALEAAAAAWGMDALLEVHTAEELQRAKLMHSALIGINNRDLATFETDLDTTKRLARSVPADRLIVSESGLATRQDLAAMARFGVRCFLVGEVLMREENVESATRALLRSPWTPEAE